MAYVHLTPRDDPPERPTPGPWKARVQTAPTNAHYVIVAPNAGDEERYVGEVWGPRELAAANARLIAAAPVLLGALQAIVPLTPPTDGRRHELVSIDALALGRAAIAAAIAKASGADAKT